MADIVYLDLNMAETANSSRHVPSEDEARDRFMAIADRVGLKLDRFTFGETEKIVRCATHDDKNGKKSGWYVIHKDGDLWFGALGDWRAYPDYEKFIGADERSIDPEQRRRIELAQELRRRELELERAQKAAEARALVTTLSPASPDHPYLVAKGIKPHGALSYSDELLLPISDLYGNVISTQTIAADGTKSFRTGCSSRGVYVIGAPSQVAVVCEGFATGASIHEATGMRVYVTFNAGNLAALTAGIAEIEASVGANIVIAADHDMPSQHHQNVGLEKAQQAAASIGGAQVVMPPFPGADWNDVATWKPQVLLDAFAGVRELFHWWQPRPDSQGKPREWLYGNHYIRRYCSLTVAQPGLGKSTLALVEAIAMATGRNLLGITPNGRYRWAYFNAEDPLDEIELRVWAVCRAFNIPQEELDGWLAIQSGRDLMMHLSVGEAGQIVEPLFQRIAGFVKFHKVDGLTLDPLANMTDSPETNEVFRRLGARLSLLAEQCNISIEIVHHTRKLGGRLAEIEDARGGSALIGMVRVARVLQPMEAEQANKYGLETHSHHFCISPAGKANHGPPSEYAVWMEKYAVRLDCGEWVAVCRQWEPPDPFDTITTDDTRAVQAALLERKQPGRAHPSANDWAGYTIAGVLDMDMDDPAQKATVKGLINGWLKTGVLALETIKDTGRGKEHKVIVVGETRL